MYEVKLKIMYSLYLTSSIFSNKYSQFRSKPFPFRIISRYINREKNRNLFTNVMPNTISSIEHRKQYVPENNSE